MMWPCRLCTMDNVDSSRQCSACGTGRPGCHEPNRQPSPVSGEIHQHPPSSVSVSNSPNIRNQQSSSSRQWECKHCTFLNHEQLQTCEMCGKNNAGIQSARRNKIRYVDGNERKDGVNELASVISAVSVQEQSRSTLEEIMAACKDTKSDFMDTDFLPCDRSLGVKDQGAGIRWYRCVNSRTRQWSLVGKGGFCPTDVRQGALGDCWFLSAVCVLAERPKLIGEILKTREVNKYGVYQVRFCKDGEYTNIIVDDFFPVQGGELYYSKTTNNQLWVPIIEKAYAKLHGSYSNIEDGMIYQAMADLTGLPCFQIKSDEFDPDMLWAKLVSCRESRFLMGASCCGKDLGESGLQDNHCYALLDVRVENNHQLVKLRNPWGKNEWNGPFSPHSPEWTPELRSKLIPTDSHAAKGVFWMDFMSFVLYFSLVDICQFYEGWERKTERGRFSEPVVRRNESDQGPKYTSDEVFLIRVQCSTTMILSITQPDQRSRRHLEYDTAPEYGGYISQGLIVSQTHSADPLDVRSYKRCAEAFPSSTRIVHCEVFATDETCTYIVSPFTFSHLTESRCFVLTIYSANPVFVERIPAKPEILTIGAQLACSVKGPEDEWLPIAGMDATLYVAHRKESIIIMAVNSAHHHPLQVTCTFEGTSGFYFSRCGQEQTRDIIPPLHRQIIMVLSVINRFHPSVFLNAQKFERLLNLPPIRHDPPIEGSFSLHSVQPL
eukprot:998270_1